MAMRYCAKAARAAFSVNSPIPSKTMSNLPARFEPRLFALPQSDVMALPGSGVATWLSSWLIAIPAVVSVTPMVRKRVARCVRSNA